MANKEFYRYAKAYDIAFNGRDYKDECDFIEWCMKNHSKIENQNKSFLELAAGPSHHAREFARRGWRSIALDLSEDMLDYAKLLSEKENVDMEYFCANMIDFKLDKPVSVAGNFTESISHILTNKNMVTHLQNVSDHLVKGGIYIIETAHPAFFFPDKKANIWTSIEGDTEVEMTFGTPEDEYDSFFQVWNVTTKLVIKKNGKVESMVESKSKHRWYLAQEMRALIELSGAFEQYYIYGNMELPPGKLDDSEDSDCMVIVMRK